LFQRALHASAEQKPGQKKSDSPHGHSCPFSCILARPDKYHPSRLDFPN
jgi:hypothetical protein